MDDVVGGSDGEPVEHLARTDREKGCPRGTQAWRRGCPRGTRGLYSRGAITDWIAPSKVFEPTPNWASPPAAHSRRVKSGGGRQHAQLTVVPVVVVYTWHATVRPVVVIVVVCACVVVAASVSTAYRHRVSIRQARQSRRPTWSKARPSRTAWRMPPSRAHSAVREAHSSPSPALPHRGPRARRPPPPRRRRRPSRRRRHRSREWARRAGRRRRGVRRRGPRAPERGRGSRHVPTAGLDGRRARSYTRPRA